MAHNTTATVIPSSAGYSAPSRDPHAMNLLSALADCNISVAINKSLRQIQNPSYNRPVDNRVQAPTAAPLFLSRSLDVCVKRATFFELDASTSLLFSASCTLFKRRFLQPTYSQVLAHSLKNIGGYGVARSNPTLPILEPPLCSRDRLPDRGPCPKILAPTHRPNSQSAAPNRRSRPKSKSASLAGALSIFTCNKKAIYSKLSPDRKRMESEQRLQSIPPSRIDVLQEMDR
jgi:hypothetical protein